MISPAIFFFKVKNNWESHNIFRWLSGQTVLQWKRSWDWALYTQPWGSILRQQWPVWPSGLNNMHNNKKKKIWEAQTSIIALLLQFYQVHLCVLSTQEKFLTYVIETLKIFRRDSKWKRVKQVIYSKNTIHLNNVAFSPER